MTRTRGVALALAWAVCVSCPAAAYGLETTSSTQAESAVSASVTQSPVPVTIAVPMVPIDRRVEDDELHVTYAGRWRTSWDRLASGNGTHRASAAGSSAGLTFRGDRVDVVSTVGPDKGQIRILLDGVEKATISLYAASLANETTVWSSGMLDAGTHNVTVVALGTAAAGSTGVAVDVDAFDLHGTPLAPASYGGSIVDERHGLLGRSGSWVSSLRDIAVGGGSRRSDSEGAWLQVTFTGTGIRWVGRKDAAGGLAAVYVDGKKVDTVSCYSASTAERRIVWELSGLPYREHTVRIRVYGQPSETGGGRAVDVDAFIVNGKLGYAARPTPFRYPWRTYIVIDKSTFKLYWVKNGTLLKEYPVAHGKVSSRTPNRVWRIDAKYMTDPKSVYGPRKMRMFKQVRTSRGTRYVFSAYAIHGTNQEWVIGTQASHGCIRMYNRDVRELFPQVPYGTMVVTRD